MIYTVTFNPAIDYVVYLDGFEAGRTNRARRELLQFGGKGINVSTVLARLGAPTTALGFIAGFTGRALAAAVAKNGVRTDFIELPDGNTRINIKLKSEQETEINACGPEIGRAQLETLFGKLEQLTAGDTLVLAGSVPDSLPSDIYEQILRRLDGRGIRFVVDATRELLRRVLPYRPFLIKPNRQELEELFDAPLLTDADLEAAAAKLQAEGAQNVLVSLGKAGALLLDETGRVFRQPALGGKPVNTVGAGDSMVAGFLVGSETDSETALRLGLAAGGATACSPELATKEEIYALLG